jgi:hypothetical protein
MIKLPDDDRLIEVAVSGDSPCENPHEVFMGPEKEGEQQVMWVTCGDSILDHWAITDPDLDVMPQYILVMSIHAHQSWAALAKRLAELMQEVKGEEVPSPPKE